MITADISKEYKTNLLEKEAYKAGTWATIETFIMENLNLTSI